MNFFRKKVNQLKPFPEFSDMDGQLSIAVNSYMKYYTSLGEANGRIYSDFINGQPQEVSEGLKECQKTLDTRIATLSKKSQSFADLRSGIQAIQSHNASMREKRKYFNSVHENKIKCDKNYEKAKLNLEKQNIKNSQSKNAMKAKHELDYAEMKKTSAEKALEQTTNSFKVENHKYKLDIYSVMMTALAAFAAKYMECIDAEIPTVPDISKASKGIHDFEDKFIDNIQDEIAKLKRELKKDDEQDE